MDKRTKKQPKIHYEPEADVLSWEVSVAPIDYAEEIGNVVVHFTKEGKPVLMELLGASMFLSKAEKIVRPIHEHSSRSTSYHQATQQVWF